jgi:hypothetical protein
MSGIQSVHPSQTKPLLRGTNTGYMALTGMGLTVAAGVCKNKTVKKCHKPLGYITAGLTLLHLGIVLHHKNEWKKKLAESEKENGTEKSEGVKNK